MRVDECLRRRPIHATGPAPRHLETPYRPLITPVWRIFTQHSAKVYARIPLPRVCLHWENVAGYDGHGRRGARDFTRRLLDSDEQQGALCEPAAL